MVTRVYILKRKLKSKPRNDEKIRKVFKSIDRYLRENVDNIQNVGKIEKLK